MSKRSLPVKSQQRLSAKVTTKNKASYPLREKYPSNSAVKGSQEVNVSLQNETTEWKKVKPKDQMESIDNENDEDLVTVLRKEIQEWRINEILSCRTEEMFTGTPSEQHSYNYVASGETTKRQRSPNSACKSHRTYIDYPAVTKSLDVVEYLDLHANPESCRSKMHSTCDCYCKTRVPIAQQRKEIHSDRVRSGKPEVIRSAKKVPLNPTKLVDDDELDSKRSTITLPVSPVLSPETNAVIEDTERLIKNAEMQIKEISTIGNLGRVRNCTDTWPDETFLDDENDQLLYIRERVAYKFQEANGWIDRNRLNSQNQQFFHEKAKHSRSIDFSDPKFRTSEERYREFVQQRKLQNQKLGFSVPIVDGKSTEETKNSKETRPVDRRSMTSMKINTCSVQTGPSVDIRAELTAQNLKSIHISPETSFVKENLNVGNYEINHDRKNPRSARKEKFVKILEDDRTSNKKKTRNSKEFDEIESNDSSASVSKEAAEKVESPEVSREGIQEADAKVETQKIAESNLNDEKLEENESSQSVRNISKDKQDADSLITKASLEMKNDQKQVRFNDEVSEESQKNRKEGTPQLELKSSSLKDETNEHKPLSSNETESRHLMNKRRHEEVCGKRKFKVDERYKIVDQRFCDVLKKYCDQEVSSSYTDRSIDDSSEDRSSLGDLYEPSMDRFDNLLTEYDKIINNVIQSTEAIDEFLSRSEYSNEFLKDQVEIMRNNHLRPSKRKDAVFKHKSSSMSKTINRERPREMRTSSIKLIKEDNNSRKSVGVSKRLNKVAGRTDLRRNEESELIKNTECTDGKRIKEIKNLKENCSCKKLSTRDLPSIEHSSLVSSSSSSSMESLDVNEGKIFQAADVRNAGKNDLDHAMLYDLVCSKILNEILPETNNMERSILRALQEETRFIEDKIKSVFNVDEIVPILAKGLLEHLRCNVSNFEPVNFANRTTREPESKEENFGNEENFSASEMTKSTVDIQSITDSKDEAPGTEEIDNGDSKSLKETSEMNSHKVSSKNSAENVSSKETASSCSARNLSEKREDLAKEDDKNDVEKNINKEENLREDVLEDFVATSEIIEEENVEDTEQKGSINLNQKKSTLNDTGSEVREANCIKSVQNTKENQISSSDSLKDCASLQSSKNVSKTSSNVIEASRKIDETNEIFELNNKNTSGAININNLDVDMVLEKDKILSEVYEDVNKKIFSSTFNTNYSTMLSQNWRLSSSVSAIESKVLTSSSSSHSEGELRMPSSGSCSAGEVRILTKNRSDGENTDDDITVFLTERMLTSWNESSKALVQSMGEI